VRAHGEDDEDGTEDERCCLGQLHGDPWVFAAVLNKGWSNKEVSECLGE